MHIPGEFLHPWMVGLFFVLSGVVLAVAAWRARGDLTATRVRLFGVVTAGIFVTQLLNWPIPGGTSAHLVGGALAAIVLGPHLGVLAVTLVLAVQALVFGDGGTLALGANVWNMAIVEAYVGYGVYRALEDRSEPLAVVAAGWIGVTLAAVSAGLQVGLSPAFDYQLLPVLAVMGGGHFLLGVGEGVLTLLGVRLLTSTGVVTDAGTSEPTVVEDSSHATATRPWSRRALGGLLALVALAPVFAWATEHVGYAEPLANAAAMTGAATEVTIASQGLLPGYAIPGLGPSLGVLVAGIVGVTVTFGVAVGSGRFLSQRTLRT